MKVHKLPDPRRNWNGRPGQKKKKLDSMLTSSFQTVIKRYNPNSQEIKIKKKKKEKSWSDIQELSLFLCSFCLRPKQF